LAAIKQAAHASGDSVTTESCSLNGEGRISEETPKKGLDFAYVLGVISNFCFWTDGTEPRHPCRDKE
jgi:hypothetical protein